MSNNEEIGIAYIDGANLHKGVKDSGWLLDYKRFRVWLKEKYLVKQAYLFIGFVQKYNYLYDLLREAGFILVFKETICNGNGEIKGNCDAELVLTAVKDAYENSNHKSILVSSDGDYACLVKFLVEKNKFRILLSPYRHCSILLKRTNVAISYLDDKKKIIGK